MSVLDGQPAVYTSLEVIPGAAVRDLVAWREQQIDALLEELDAALREAEEAERRLAELPAAGFLDRNPGLPASGGQGLAVSTSAPAPAPPPSESWPLGESWPLAASSTNPPEVPSEAPTSPSGVPVVSDRTAHTNPRTTVVPRTTVPRTTVVARPAAAAPPRAVTTDGNGHPDATPRGSTTRGEIVEGRSQRESWTARFRTHWMMKVGMVIAIMGIVLLKFG